MAPPREKKARQKLAADSESEPVENHGKIVTYLTYYVPSRSVSNMLLRRH